MNIPKRKRRSAWYMPHALVGSLAMSAAFLASLPVQALLVPEDLTKTTPVLHRRNDDGAIDPLLAQQLIAVIAEKNSRTPAQQKIDSQLLYTLKRRRNDPLFKQVPTLDTDLFVDNKGLVVVDVRGTITDGLLNAIPALGGEVVRRVASRGYLRAFFPVDKLEQLAARSEVKAIEPPIGAQTDAYGSVVTEGDVTHKADVARTTFGVTGSGVKVGVLSDSYTTADVAETGPVTSLFNISGTNEGSAMLEIVKDLAPGADLYFATAYSTPDDFAAHIRALRDAGCSVISDDVYYFNVSPFHDGPIAQAVNDVTSTGVAYFSSAGNNYSVDRNIHSKPTTGAGYGASDAYESDFTDSGIILTSGGVPLGNLHQFGPNALNLVTGAGYMSPASRFTVAQNHNLFWSDPVGK